MRNLLYLLSAVLFLSQGQLPGAAAQRSNVLFVVFDDLNDWMIPGEKHPNMLTPHLDAFAQSGVSFTNAHTNSPACNPARASFFSGKRPTTLGVVDNWTGFYRDREKNKALRTLPQYFKDHGYFTYGLGKLFHYEWKDWPEFDVKDFPGYGPYPKERLGYAEGGPVLDWGAFNDPEAEEGSWDKYVVDKAVDVLNQKHETPFFLAVGILRPHLPMFADQKWFDMHPIEKILRPDVLLNDNDDLPRPYGDPKYIAELDSDEQNSDWVSHEWVLENDKWEELIQAYAACSTYADAQFGRLMESLKKSAYADNTLIVVLSDHGWHLGEKQTWGKLTLWEESTRVPLMFAGPGIPKGETNATAVELLSLYPTLAELMNLSKPQNVEGRSIAEMVKMPSLQKDGFAVTTYGPKNHTIRTNRYRLICYENGQIEFYDHEKDPHEWLNLAQSTQHQAIIKSLRNKLENELGAEHLGTLSLAMDQSAKNAIH